MRRKIIAGNWKMNKLPNEALLFVEKEILGKDLSPADVVLCVSYVNFSSIAFVLGKTNIALGAQNMHWEDKGAYTGEISADMLLACNIEYVILGHSERREHFYESDEIINKKVKKALEKGIIPILCVGESLETREKGEEIEFIRSQIFESLKDINADDAKRIVIAYEPIWAIGTGKTATAEQAEQVCLSIRNMIKEIYDSSISDYIRIQYGGSVNSKNAKEIFSMPNIDGALIGGASLTKEFVDIISLA